MTWLYEPDEKPRRKHHWPHDHAGFTRVGTDKFIGKCPGNMTLDQAQSVLDRAIPWSPINWRSSHPKRLYTVVEGVLFRATETVPGRSYHGFPEHPTRFPKGARPLKEQLLEQARQASCEKELRQWMNW